MENSIDKGLNTWMDQGSLEDLDRKASLGPYQCGPISQLIEYLVTSYSDLLVIPGGSNRLLFCGDILGLESFDYRLLGKMLIGFKKVQFLI